MGAGAGVLGLLGGIAVGGAEPAGAARWMARHGWGHHGPHGGHGGQEHGRRAVAWMLDEIEASDEQRVQVEAIFEELHTSLGGMHEAHHAYRETFVEALTGESVDATALEEIRAASLELAEQASLQLTEAIAEVARVLTPEQRAALADLHARHH
jgi:Spy/CpxP family protein refolding chaperone